MNKVWCNMDEVLMVKYMQLSKVITIGFRDVYVLDFSFF